MQAKEWGERWLGLTNVKPEEIKRRREVNQKAAKERDRVDQLQLEKNRGSAKAMWLAAKPLNANCPVTMYLQHRGIDLASTFVKANAIRFSPAMKHGESGLSCQCMIAAMSDASGQIVAVHRTWLRFIDPHFEVSNFSIKACGHWDKAPLAPPRKIWPAFTGSVIRIHKGSSKLSPEAAEKKGLSGPCVITEGVEDGLAIAISRPDLRVWAAGSLGNLANVPRLPCVSEFIVCQDNDWGKPQAEQQFNRAIRSLGATGVRLSIARSWIGKDANDLLKGDNHDDSKAEPGV